MKIRTIKLKKMARRAFKDQKADVILTLGTDGSLTASKTPQAGDSVITEVINPNGRKAFKK